MFVEIGCAVFVFSICFPSSDHTHRHLLSPISSSAHPHSCSLSKLFTVFDMMADLLITQSDLEYDPALYQRDRGELDWDARSVSSANLLAMDNKSALYAPSITGRASPAPSKGAYDRYLAQGPSQTDIEMTRFDGSDQLPLLTSQQAPGYFDPMNRSNVSLPYGTPSAPSLHGSPEVPGVGAPLLPSMAASQPYREAPVHRPYPSREMSGSPGPYQAYGQPPPPQQQQQQYQQQYQQQPYQQQPYGQYPPQPSRQGSPGGGQEQNMAGRGAFRR